jgi:hypothetical protein
MCCARAKVAMMSIGAPQCGHTKVGRTQWVAAGGCGEIGGQLRCGLIQELASGGDLGPAVGIGE